MEMIKIKVKILMLTTITTTRINKSNPITKNSQQWWCRHSGWTPVTSMTSAGHSSHHSNKILLLLIIHHPHHHCQNPANLYHQHPLHPIYQMSSNGFSSSQCTHPQNSNQASNTTSTRWCSRRHKSPNILWVK